jgi:hypothetical protein
MDMYSRKDQEQYRKLQDVSYELLNMVQGYGNLTHAEMCLCLLWAASSFVDKHNKRVVVAQLAAMADKAVEVREQEGM